MYLKITLHSAAAEEIIKNYITFLDPGGINYVIIVGPTVMTRVSFGRSCLPAMAPPDQSFPKHGCHRTIPWRFIRKPEVTYSRTSAVSVSQLV